MPAGVIVMFSEFACCSTSETMPETTGAAMEVPLLIVLACGPVEAKDVTFTP